MNRGSRRGCAIALLAGLVLCSAAYAVVYVFEPFPDQVQEFPGIVSEHPNTGELKFNVDTILGSLDRGATDIFVATPPSDKVFASVMDSDPPPWHQAEYVRIAGAAFQHVWAETPRGWNLYRMAFDTRCASVERGFARADFVFFQPVWRHGRLKYTGREILIRPLDKVVSWGGGTNYPHPLLGWRGIDLDHLGISADEALHIAELNGGERARLGVKNRCDIGLTLLPNAYGGEWSVLYVSTTNKRLLDLSVDIDTGGVLK